MGSADNTQTVKLHSDAPALTGFVGLLVFFGLSFAVGAFGAQFETGPWYQQLAKPVWTPPGWVFGPVWTILYISMALSAWLVWRRGGFARNLIPLTVYLIQLLFNALWSWIFFGMNQIGLALVDIILLTAAVFVTTLLFFKRQRLAGILLVPYLLWVSFATLLNLQIWLMN